jgi:predicted HAD superfamily hydrolase
MNKKKLISVVVPVYNTEEYLERCLDSLLKQTYSNLQIIVVNDASTGNEKDIIKYYQTIDKRILYVEHEKNMGLFKARVTGSLKATGDYIAFVDSDDYIGIDFYRLLLEDAEKNQSDMVLARTVMEENEKVVFGMHDIAFPDEILEGESVLNTFLAQEGRCYGWHTMWNKLYRKNLWDICLPYYEKQNEHIVMMEDIAFSFPLFYFAKKISKVENSTYYYCQNSGSSTDSKSATFEKMKKNLGDIFKVFEFVKNFLKTVNASDYVFNKYYDFRNYYIRDWKKGIASVENIEDGQKLLEMISSFYGEVGDFVKEDGFFRMVRTVWNDELEEIKKRIWNPEHKYISFDIFDTLITRPFYRPTDLFYLLDKLYEKECRSNVSFRQIRIDGEICARNMIQKQYPDYQDVNIDEIYQYIEDTYGIPTEICSALKEQEKELEIQFCNVRKTTKELYDFALYAGKKIILVSDMYLDEETIKKILERNGYRGYSHIFLSSKERKLKHTGDLFQMVLDKLQISANHILHMGDNYNCDILKASESGFHTAYIPRTINVFENKVKGFDTGECSTLAQKVSGVILDRSKILESIGYGSMTAIIANYYFDNPFRPFNSESDYNTDPYFIGYYALGMHLAGLLKWISKQTLGYKRILFMARDGFLVKQAYDIWAKYIGQAPKSEYIYISRKMLLPMSINSTVEFMNLPIVYNQYSPSAILELLNFCTKKMAEEDRIEILKNAEILIEKKFESKYEYQNFMKFYLEYFYDEDRHVKSKKLLERYYEDVKETDIAFDIGYSGNIQNAFVQVVGKSIDVLFVHGDAVKSMQMSRKGKFKIETFYDFSPAVSGLLREHILSDYNPTCIGIKQEGDAVIPVFGTVEKPFTDTFVIDKIHKGALQFITDYCSKFKDYFEYVTFKNYEVSLPFEAFLRIPKGKDMRIFEGSYFEDKVYGRQDAINIAKFMENQYKVMPQFAGEETIELFRNAFIDSMRYNRKLVYFGTGRVCRDILAEYPDLPVSFFLDNNKKNNDTYLEGKEIKHPEEIENWNEVYIIITTYYSSEIEKQLTNLGLLKYKDFINFNELFKIV